MLRRPQAFIRSYHNQLLMNLDEDEKDLRKAWEASENRRDATMPATCREPSFLDYKKVGRFSEQIARYLDLFRRDQIRIVLMEDWVQTPRTLCVDLMSFLKLDDDGRQDFDMVHTASTVRFGMLRRLTQRPPALLKWASRAMRSVPGLGSVRPVDVVRRLNSTKGYASSGDANLLSEIDDYFADDQKAVRALIGFGD